MSRDTTKAENQTLYVSKQETLKKSSLPHYDFFFSGSSLQSVDRDVECRIREGIRKRLAP